MSLTSKLWNPLMSALGGLDHHQVTSQHESLYGRTISSCCCPPFFKSLSLYWSLCHSTLCVCQCKSKITFPFKTRERQPWERRSYLSYSPCCLNLDFTHHPYTGRVHLAIRSSFNCAQTTFKMPFHCLVSFGSIDLRIIVESGGFLSAWSS